jgi:hypothetical protein
MPSNTLGTAARVDPRNVANTMVGICAFGTTGIGSGIKFGTLPMGARITDVIVEVITAFNAATTNVLTVGTNSTSFNNIVNASDVNEAATGATRVDRGIGGLIARAADIDVYIMYTQSGTAATTGSAEVTIVFEGGWTN